MHTFRTKNAALFVTVLSACLGLVVVGAPTEARARPSSAVDQLGFVKVCTPVRVNDRRPSNQVYKFPAIHGSRFASVKAKTQGGVQPVFYRNRGPLARNNQVLIVKRLPRAGLEPAAA